MWVNLLLVIISAILVIGADAAIKCASQQKGWITPFASWIMVLCYMMYFIQIIAAFVIFKAKGSISIYTNLFVIFYAILGVFVGSFFFHETIVWWKYIGIVLGLIGAFILCS